MTENKTYIVRVPATTANIGSGFDTLGMSLGLYNVVQFVPTEGKALLETEISAEGEGAGQVTSGLDNMIIKAMDETAKEPVKLCPVERCILSTVFRLQGAWLLFRRHCFRRISCQYAHGRTLQPQGNP